VNRPPAPPSAPPRPEAGETRRRRDAALRSADDAIAEHLAQAMRSGELQRAPSFGKPMPEAEGWHDTPVEFRLPFKILKDAGLPPPEVELFQARARLREQLAAAATEAERTSLQAALGELEQRISLRLEGMRASGKL
jgi:hypothetical protein